MLAGDVTPITLGEKEVFIYTKENAPDTCVQMSRAFLLNQAIMPLCVDSAFS